MDMTKGAINSRPASHGISQDQSRTKQYESDQAVPKKQNRNRRAGKQGGTQTDGFASDSATMPATSPRPVKNGQPRSYAQIAPGSQSNRTQRPVSTNGSGPPATPAKEQAYAGSTFQASPAASSLPVPKLFGRSLPNTTSLSRNGPDLFTSNSPNRSSPRPDAIAASAIPPRASQQSPLDFFFEADRVERENIRSQSESLSPQTMSQSRPVSRQTPGGLPGGGNARLPPDFGDHMKENITPQRHPPQRSPLAQSVFPTLNPSPPKQPIGSQSQDQVTESLKHLLFNIKATPPAPSTPPGERETLHDTWREGSDSPSPFYQRNPSPHTPAHAGAQQNDRSFHYGNRNLSPLFKAARDTPSQPSGLRQEMFPFEDQSGESFGPTMQHAHMNSFSQGYQNGHFIDARGHPPGRPNHHALPMHGHMSRPDQPYGPYYDTTASPPPQPAPPNQTAADVQSMEENLRRMLNLNVLS